jgi:uncharacterized UPF0146 family protein
MSGQNEIKSENSAVLRVVNIGIGIFYDSLAAQSVEAVQLDWSPPVKNSEEINKLLDDLL